MSALHSATLTITLDEPAIRLRERHVADPVQKSLRREQVIEVVRNDRIVEWRQDMGPAEAYIARQFQIIGGFEYEGKIHSFETVGRLRDIADQMRARTKEEWDGLSPDEVMVDWEKEYHDEVDRRRLAASRRGVNGPWHSRM